MKEFADFLGGQPPFDALDPDDMARLVSRVEVEYFAAGATVVVGGRPLSHLWVVRTGALEVVDRGRVVDLLGAGDSFGHVWLLSASRRRWAYGPTREPVPAHPGSADVLLRTGCGSRPSTPAPGGSVHGRRGRRARPTCRWPASSARSSGAPRQTASATSPSGSAGPAFPARWCARPAGWESSRTTTSRRRVAAGQVSLDAPVTALATVPALTIEADASQAAGLLRMVEHAVHHLVVVDGDGHPTGVLRAVDLAQADLRDPLLIRSAVEEADDIGELAEACRLLRATLVELHDNDVAPTHIGALHATVVDAVVRRALRLHRDPVLDGVRLSWVLLGSLARPLTSALVRRGHGAGLGRRFGRRGRDRTAAGEVLRELERCGLKLCADGANADNPAFSRSAPNGSATPALGNTTPRSRRPCCCPTWWPTAAH